MKTRLYLFVLLVAFTAASHPAFAQRGGGRGGGGGRDEGKRSSSAPELPSGNDIDKLDPIAMLVSNQKDLELSPEIVGSLSTLDAQLIRTTKPSLATVDSLRTAIKASAESPDARGAIRETMNAYNRAVAEIRTQLDDATKKALELLTGDSRQKAEKLIAQRREAFDKVTRK